MCYAYSENFILPLSHDEVVHLKGSLMNKMFGDYDTKFMQLKALLGFQYAHPGKKLNFMGGELAQWNECNENKELDWMLLNYPKHAAHQRFVLDLNRTYKKYKPLYQNDKSWEGFLWRLADDSKNSVLAFERIDKSGNIVLVIINFSSYDYHNYGVTVTKGSYDLILNSDSELYGGKNKQVDETLKTDKDGFIEINIPAFSVMYYYHPKATKK
jgi:1,4-alpha-glucan branching enzyme